MYPDMFMRDGMYLPWDDPRWRKFKNEPAAILAAAFEHVTDWGRAIDGGAHVGGWTRFLSERFSYVEAFELSTLNADCLKRNMADYRNVTCYNVALGADTGMVDYEGDGAADSTVARVIDGVRIPLEAIDAFEFPSCGLIKLDLQGYDYYALRGAERTVRAFKPVLIVEHDRKCYLRYDVTDDMLPDFLEGLGYVLKKTDAKDQLWVHAA